jgi:cytochrome b subunit of formate dehydrogenase
MEMVGKLSRLWIVNVISFFLFSLLSVTGLINWLLLPRGYGSGAGFLVSLRHSLVTVHEWTALLFMIVIGVHISLHWAYVKKSLDKYRKKSSSARENSFTHGK